MIEIKIITINITYAIFSQLLYVEPNILALCLLNKNIRNPIATLQLSRAHRTHIPAMIIFALVSSVGVLHYSVISRFCKRLTYTHKLAKVFRFHSERNVYRVSMFAYVKMPVSATKLETSIITKTGRMCTRSRIRLGRRIL